ncbi:hypothetical protein IW492_15635 [Enterococcus sp. BWB1-3]|uniref:hypothetical protein n=1 Tax=Enterococcus sp. BWB1-3 TaxID=2787713 RepID=UPI001F2E59FC|nr:hypothetical protein [Enterococcus sp. BWB1-3]MBL1230661.1 hypothetical protein [Enterococcus sp. BWB1-3]
MTSPVEKSYAHFKKLCEKCEVWYVTTSREQDFDTYNEIVRQMELQKTSNIFLTNCPSTEGNMATQINYCAKSVSLKKIIAIYNIDSFPTEEVFDYVNVNMRELNIFQQVSFSDDSLNKVMGSAQRWQNRWSIIYELGKILEVSKSNFGFIYTIGHGFFITNGFFQELGMYSEDELNEDNEFGYRLRKSGIKIHPIPFLEKVGFFSYFIVLR